MGDFLKARMLLRVSSRQQLDADGDLPAQRRIVEGYIGRQREWKLDEEKPEYHELGVSGYKNTVAEREVLQEILTDAKKHTFHILVCYKDDRLGRREDEIPAYIKELAVYGVLVYTVKEGCITPQSHIDNLMTFIRYWSAQGDSIKTAQRVKDTAIEQVRMGKNQGGNAPFGYRLVLSGELSKHQRALKKKIIVPEEAELVERIYYYALTYGYGAYRLAKLLNAKPAYRKLARNGVWKAGTVGDILKNPVYTGYEAYNRRSREGDGYHRLDRQQWILSERCNEEIKIIEKETWERVQKLREGRKEKYLNGKGRKNSVRDSTAGQLPLLDVAYCGYCGRKLTNGSKYNYWTTKAGEKRRSMTRYYCCQRKRQGEGCEGRAFYPADKAEAEVYEFVREILSSWEDNTLLEAAFWKKQLQKKKNLQRKSNSLQKQQQECRKRQLAYEEKLPEVLCGELAIPVSDYYRYIEEEKRKYDMLRLQIEDLQLELKKQEEKKEPGAWKPPTWWEVIDTAGPAVKKLVVNQFIERLEMREDELVIIAKVNLENDCDSCLERDDSLVFYQVQCHNRKGN